MTLMVKIFAKIEFASKELQVKRLFYRNKGDLECYISLFYLMDVPFSPVAR